MTYSVQTNPDGTQNVTIDINAGPDQVATPASGPMQITLQNDIGGDDSFEQDYGKHIESRQLREANAGMAAMGVTPPQVDPITEWEEKEQAAVVPKLGARNAQQEEAKNPEVQQPGPISQAWDVTKSQGAAFLQGTWKGVANLLRPLDDMAELTHKLVTTRLKDAGWTDEDLERAGVGKKRLFENMLGWTDHYIKDLDKQITTKDFFTSIFSALGQAPVGMLEFAYGAGWYPMRSLIESAHQSAFGAREGETPTIGRQVTNNPAGAAAIDAATGYMRWGMGKAVNDFSNTYGAVVRTLGQAGWGALEAAADPARVAAGQTPTTEEMATGAAVQGLFGLVGGGKPEGWQEGVKLTPMEKANLTKAMGEAWDAYRAGDMDGAQMRMVQTVMARHPEFDQQTALKVTNELKFASDKIMADSGLQTKPGDQGLVVGSTTHSFEADVRAAAIKLYLGFGTDTVLHEYGHHLFDFRDRNSMRALEAKYKAQGGDVNSQAFREYVVNGFTDWFMKNDLVENPVPSGVVSQAYRQAADTVKGIVDKVRGIAGNAVESEYRQAWDTGVNDRSRKAEPTLDSYSVKDDPKAFIKHPGGGVDYGYVPKAVAQSWGGKEAPIRLQNGDANSGAIHIDKEHGSQIQKAGFSDIMDYVAYVVDNYNTAYRGNDNAIHLVVKGDKPWHTATIKMEYVPDGDYYAVKTATPRRDTFFENDKGEKKKPLVWEGAPSLHRGEATPSAISDQTSGSFENIPTSSPSGNPVDPNSSYQVRALTPDASSLFYQGDPEKSAEVRERVVGAGDNIIKNSLPEQFEKYAVNINMDKVAATGDVKQVIQEVARAIPAELDDAKRGVISHKETMARAVEALATDTGMSVATLLSRRAGEAFNNQELIAAHLVLNSSAKTIADMAQAVRNGANSDPMLLEFASRMDLHAAIQAQATGATAEAGRALNALKMVRGVIKIPGVREFNPAMVKAALETGSKEPQDFRLPGESPATPAPSNGKPVLSRDTYGRLLETAGGRRVLEDLAIAIANLADTGANLTQLNVAVQQAQQRTSRDWILGYRYHCMLSIPATHIANTTGNALVMALAPVETAIAGMLGVASRAMGSRSQDHVYLGEAKELVYGYLGATMDSLRLAGQVLKTNQDPFGTTKMDDRPSITMAQDAQTPVGRAAELAWVGMGLPSRALQAEDAFFKNEAFRGHLRRLAYRTAAMEGLDGPAMTSRIQELLNNPTDKMLADSLDQAKYQTFQNDLQGAIARIAQATQSRDGVGFVAKVLVPFLKTPWNIAEYTLTRTPLAPLFRSFRDDMRAGGARAEMALSRVIVGSALLAVGTSLVNQGIITGGGPSDPGERTVWLMNFQPYSVKVGDTWYSYGRFEPVATLLALSADFHDAYTHWASDPDVSAGELAKAITIAFSKNITSKSFMQGVSEFAGVLNQPDQRAATFFNSLAGSFVPGYLGNWAAAIDPELRLVGGMLDAIKNKIPGLRGGLPVRRNIWGEPIPSTELGPPLAYISPIKVFTNRADDVEKEMLRLGMSVSMPKETITLRDVPVELTKAEYSRYMQLVGEVEIPRRGQRVTIKEYLSDMIDSPGYQRLADRDAQAAGNVILDVIHEYQGVAREALLQENDRIATIVQDGIDARKVGR